MNSKQRTLVNLESPYAGDIELNTLYARFCMHDSIINHGEAPFASHLLYTQPHVLREEVPRERQLGIEAGRDFSAMTQKTIMYLDLGLSSGMRYANEHAGDTDHPIEQRTLPEDLWNEFTRVAIELQLTPPGVEICTKKD